MRIPPTLALDRRPTDVLAVGENSIDIMVVLATRPKTGAKGPVRRLSHLPGGQVASAAAALATLGRRTEYIGRVGDDDLAQAGVESLEAVGVGCSGIVRCAGIRSRSAIILVEEDTGERTVLWDRDPALALDATDVSDQALDAAAILLIDDGGDAAAEIARRARRAGARTVVDVDSARPGLDALLMHIDVIIAAQGVPEAITGESDTGRALAALQAATSAGVVCVTLGREGSLARVAGGEVRTAAFRVPVVDTTGAGDLFRAGFIHGWLGAATDLEGVLRHANAVAALGCLGLGARGHLPAADEVATLLQSAA